MTAVPTARAERPSRSEGLTVVALDATIIMSAPEREEGGRGHVKGTVGFRALGGWDSNAIDNKVRALAGQALIPVDGARRRDRSRTTEAACLGHGTKETGPAQPVSAVPVPGTRPHRRRPVVTTLPSGRRGKATTGPQTPHPFVRGLAGSHRGRS